MASSSNPPDAIARIQDYEYLYASNTNVSNFVSVKLSGYENYDIWKTQMLCLMEAHEMCWLVDDSGTPKDLSKKIMKKYDSLLKGWIFGSVKEDVLRIVVDPKYSAKGVWKKLNSYFDPKKDSTTTKVQTETGTKDNNMALGKTATNDECITSKKPEAKGKEIIQIETKDSMLTKVDTKIETENKMALEETTTNEKGLCSEISEATNEEATQIETEDSAASKVDKEIETERDYAETETNKLRQLIADKNWFEEYFELEERNALAEKINPDGNTLIHIAIGMGRNKIIDSLISNFGAIDLTVIKNSDGSTVLHIAAIVGNAYAAKRLSRCDPRLLDIRDYEDETPLDKAYKNEHLLTIAYLEKRKYGRKIKKLPKLIVDENWSGLYFQLLERRLLHAKINSDGDRLLHIAVRIGDEILTSKILGSILIVNSLKEKTNSNGSTVLHIAAIVCNKKAAKLLVKKHPNLLYTKDNEGHTPLDKANENSHRNVASLLVAAEKETNKFRKQIVDGDWHAVYLKLKDRNALTEKIDSDGNTLLHKAVEISRNDLVKKVLPHMREHDFTEIINSDGSTILHVAAIVGNMDAATLLVKHDRKLLDIRDNEGKTPLDKANENGHHTLVNLQEDAKKTEANELRQLILDGNWYEVIEKLYERNALTEKINSDGNTLLHKVVGMGDGFLTRTILWRINEKELTKIKNLDGSTALHIAAIVGNTYAARRLVEKNKELLHTKDNEEKTALDKAYQNMHLDTIAYLLEATKDLKGKVTYKEAAATVDLERKKDIKIGIDLLANAISAKRYGE